MVETKCFMAVGVGSIPGQGTKILHAMWCSKKIKERKKEKKMSASWWGPEELLLHIQN